MWLEVGGKQGAEEEEEEEDGTLFHSSHLHRKEGDRELRGGERWVWMASFILSLSQSLMPAEGFRCECRLMPHVLAQVIADCMCACEGKLRVNVMDR